MITIAKLFGKSPFAPLQGHMKKVSACVKKLTEVFEALKAGNQDSVHALVKELSKLEHEANLTKNDIRNHLPRSLFLPIDRPQFLEILSVQDDIADKAQEVGDLLTLRPLENFDQLGDGLCTHYKNNAEGFTETRQILKEFDELLESSFGGIEAEKVRSMVDSALTKTYEADKFRREFRKQFFSVADKFSAPTFYLWMRLIDEIGAIGAISARLANRIRTILELK